MAELFRFRCSECSKLLGVSARKVGKVVECPRCRVELIVPAVDAPDTPGDSGAEMDLDAVEFADLGIDLGSTAPMATRPVELPPPLPRPPVEAEALAFLERAAGPASVRSSTEEPTIVAELLAGAAAGHDRPMATNGEPVVPAPRRRRRPAPADHRRDVVLPRTASILGTIFALLALALSFVAGLMIGHYRWK